ncbi:LPS export ABC transporter periplasmic protein LptC [Aliikangiella sp. G2MR2-5]|uniref:LPS export ABC transporter periplasmic protein LptC n=1 Tax=Aliikangiella sp. G2MR2-5 TaxID=2788943 RepID=UPI0018AC8B8F|nr:LPS export ABC transporter periplasmic protein LptC [Aliikangiella sp. G2MR2-5]
MSMTLKTAIICSLLAAILAFFYWSPVFIASSDKEVSSFKKPDTQADYYFENVKIETFDASGFRLNQIVAQKIEHFDSTKTSEIAAPKVIAYSESDAQWLINAAHGKVNHQSEEIQLEGSVKLTQTAQYQLTSPTTTQIDVDDLSISLNQNTATSENGVKILSGNYYTTAKKLNAQLKENTISLSGQVVSSELESELQK